MIVYIFKNIQIACLNINNIPRIGETMLVATDKKDPFSGAEIVKGVVDNVEWITSVDKCQRVIVNLK